MGSLFPMHTNMFLLWTYAQYIVLSLALTIWVGRSLFKNGRPFLVDAFSGNEKLADSVNHLLRIGLYLINIGYVSIALRYGDKPTNFHEAIETLSSKMGYVLLVIGLVHFLVLAVMSSMRKRALLQSDLPPFAPEEQL